MKNYFVYTLLLAIICLAGLNVSAAEISGDHEFCGDHNYSNGQKVSFRDLREITVPATGLLSVDGKRNGGIKVIGEDRADVLVRACINAWAETENEAQSIAKNIRIEKGSVIQAVEASDEKHWSVSYQILVPRATNLNLRASNGGISIDSVQGTLEFETVNGGVKLNNIGGSVKGRTTNGGVKVNLSGTTWVGNGLDVETVNGGVKLNLPANYSANIETGTVNGGFKSDFAELSVPKDEKNNWSSPKRVNASLNGGGATLRLITTNGGVKISSQGNL